VRSLLAALAAAAAGIPMLIAVAQLPRVGAPDAPIHTHVAAHYLARSPSDTGADNAVTGVLLNYRAFDTFGEVMIIFAALTAVMAVRSPAVAESFGGARSPSSEDGAPLRRIVPVSPIVAYVVRLTAPLIVAFASWMILRGHMTPGGGFQGGAMIGALLILLAIVRESEPLPSPLGSRALHVLQAAGPLAFGAVACAGVGLAGVTLALPSEPALHALREVMLLVMEAGIATGGAAIVLGLFLAIRGT
jgi:multicomponent Na+:H+ antiporter subunit B